MAQIQTHITRGNIIESTHKSKCVIKNYNYKTVFSTKNNKDLVYPRSAIKILQAIPFIQSQAKNKYNLTQKKKLFHFLKRSVASKGYTEAVTWSFTHLKTDNSFSELKSEITCSKTGFGKSYAICI